MGIVVDIENGDWIMDCVWKDVILARIPDGVLLDGSIATYGRNEMSGELSDVGV